MVEIKGEIKMDEFTFFKVVMAHSDYASGYVVFIVKAEYAKQALIYVEKHKKGQVTSIEPTEYFDFISVPKDYLAAEKTGYVDKH